MDTRKTDSKKGFTHFITTVVLIVIALCLIVQGGLMIGRYRISQTEPPAHLIQTTPLPPPSYLLTPEPRRPIPLNPDPRADWPEGSDRFLNLKTEFTLSNPVARTDLPRRNPSMYSYVGSAAVDCMFTITQDQIDCEQVAKRLPVLLPDEVFQYYCVDGVCMEPGNCVYIVGSDPFWYDPRYMVDDVEALRKEYYPTMQTMCGSPKPTT